MTTRLYSGDVKPPAMPLAPRGQSNERTMKLISSVEVSSVEIRRRDLSRQSNETGQSIIKSLACVMKMETCPAVRLEYKMLISNMQTAAPPGRQNYAEWGLYGGIHEPKDCECSKGSWGDCICYVITLKFILLPGSSQNDITLFHLRLRSDGIRTICGYKAINSRKNCDLFV